MSVRPDNRLRDAPMQPVLCQECGAGVLVRKSSWEQTSVQWNAASLQQCTRRREAIDSAGSVGAQPAFMQVCPNLRDAIEAAVHRGELPVLDVG